MIFSSCLAEINLLNFTHSWVRRTPHSFTVYSLLGEVHRLSDAVVPDEGERQDAEVAPVAAGAAGRGEDHGHTVVVD